MCGRRQHKGFTLVEMLVVIAVLLVLASITVVGLGRFSGPAKGKATLLSMENLRGLQAAYEAETGRQAPYGGILDTTFDPPALCAPNDVAMQSTDALGRYGQATIATQRILRQFLKVPANKQAYSRLPTNQQMPVLWASGITYKPGDELKEGNKFYRLTGAPTTSGPPGTGWTEVTEHQTVPLDGWGNPIIYVPKDSLGIPATKKLVRASSGTQRPFWASAGDDGKFSGAEDNVYSFEN